MWQSSLNTVTGIDQAFNGFLESDEYLDIVRTSDSGTPCVLDIVGLWLSEGTNILDVGSFELLLCAIIGMADDWGLSGRKSFLNYPFWPDPESGLAREIKFSRPEGQHSEDLDMEIGITHSVLLRQNFEATVAAVRQRQHRELVETIGQST